MYQSTQKILFIYFKWNSLKNIGPHWVGLLNYSRVKAVSESKIYNK